MKVIPLSNEERHNGFTHLVVLTHEDLTNTSVSGTPTQTIEVMDVEAGHLVRTVAMKLVTPFKDASDAAQNATLIEVGDGSDTDRFLASTEINENGTEVRYKGGTGTLFAYTAADTLDVKFTGTTSKALSEIDTGELHLFVAITPLAILSEANA